MEEPGLDREEKLIRSYEAEKDKNALQKQVICRILELCALPGSRQGLIRAIRQTVEESRIELKGE